MTRASFLLGSALALLPLCAARAEPLLAFSFNGEQGLTDSIGGLQFRLRQGAKIVTLPSPSGLGAHFAGGSGALSLTGSNGSMGLVTGMPELEGSFTVEARVNLLGLPPRLGHLIAMAGDFGAPRDYAWMFLVRTDGKLGAAPRELVLVLSDGKSYAQLNSGFIIEPGVDYHLAASADLEGGSVTFHRQRLDGDHAPEQVVKAHEVKHLNRANLLQVGDSLSSLDLAFGGLIDELRISKGALAMPALQAPAAVGAR